MSEVVLNTAKAAARVGLSNVYMRRLRTTGGGPRYVQLGRSVRYRTVDLDEWLESRLRHSTSDEAA